MCWWNFTSDILGHWMINEMWQWLRSHQSPATVLPSGVMRERCIECPLMRCLHGRACTSCKHIVQGCSACRHHRVNVRRAWMSCMHAVLNRLKFIVLARRSIASVNASTCRHDEQTWSSIGMYLSIIYVLQLQEVKPQQT